VVHGRTSGRATCIPGATGAEPGAAFHLPCPPCSDCNPRAPLSKTAELFSNALSLREHNAQLVVGASYLLGRPLAIEGRRVGTRGPKSRPLAIRLPSLFLLSAVIGTCVSRRPV
jgi:hypothetical protein